MSAINNLKGTIVKDGRVVYSEQLESGLHFCIIVMYGSNQNNSSSQLSCDAVVTTGNKHTYGNGVISLDDAKTIETVESNNKFSDLRENLKTKDGFIVSQKVVSSHPNAIEFTKDGKTITYKSRELRWFIDVPKIDMIKFCGF